MQSDSIRGNQRQSSQAIIVGTHRRQSSLAIIRGSHRPTSADFGRRLVGRRPVVGQRLGRVDAHHTPSSEARRTLVVHRVCARVDGAVVGVWVAPSWAYRWRRLRSRCARRGSPVGKRAGAPWWALECKAGGASGLTENLLCGQMPPKDVTFPFGGK